MKDEMNKAEMDKETEESFIAFSKILDEELSNVINFTEADTDKLFAMIFENLEDLSDLAIATDTIKEKIILSQDAKSRLKYQINMTRKDIFEENLINIYLVYNISVLGIWLTSPNVIEFLKRFLIVGLIGITSFDLNSRYFVSNYRKEKAKLIMNEIDKYVEISKYDVQNINRFREMYIEALKMELSKLSEFKNNKGIDNDKNLDKIFEWLHELNLDYLVEDKKVKRRIR